MPQLSSNVKGFDSGDQIYVFHQCLVVLDLYYSTFGSVYLQLGFLFHCSFLWERTDICKIGYYLLA